MKEGEMIRLFCIRNVGSRLRLQPGPLQPGLRLRGIRRHTPLLLGLVLAATAAPAQTAELAPTLLQPTSLPDAPGLLATAIAPVRLAQPTVAQPAIAQTPAAQETPQQARANQLASATRARCPAMSWRWHEPAPTPGEQPCEQDSPLQSIVSTGHVAPLSPEQKGELAAREIVSPFNLLTVFGYSAIYVAAESHSPYGPGFQGFGRLSGYSLLEDTQGEFFGTFLIPTLAQEDPRYHRDPEKPVPMRILHALAHTVVSQHDDGTLMPNYAVLLTYPISAELSNLYVPGIGTTGGDTRKRILLGYATNPAGDLVAEFLPDVARRIHIRVVFVQQIVNKLATGSPQ